MLRTNFVFVLSLAVAAPGTAQQNPTPYAGLEGREIKALSADEINGLLNGDGMSMALAAELNGYPGPKHVLEMSDSLGLSNLQVERTREIFVDMQKAAQDLGQRILDEERRLDQLFAGRSIDSSEVIRLSTSIGSLRGELRAAHLSAHLRMIALLDEHQNMRYQELRGYDGPGHAHRHVPGS